MAYTYFETTVSALESAKRTVSNVDYYDLSYTTLDYTPLYSTTQVEADKYVSDVGDTLKVTIGVNELDRSSNPNLWIVNTSSSRVEINTSDSAWTSLNPQNDDLVRLTRVSKKDAPYVDYANAAVLTEQDLDAQAKQSLHVVQESIDIANDALPLATDGKWDGKSKVIKNIATPIASTDAVNKAFADTVLDTAGDHRDDALDHRDTAESYAVKTGAVVQVFSGASNNTSDPTPSDQAGVFSAKEHAVGTTVTTGSAKAWATDPGSAQVASTDYSAKAWASDTANNIGSSKDWATKTNAVVASSDGSAKAWAIGGTGVTDTASKGAAKEWATETSSTVDTSEYSAKEYAQGTQASTGGSAKNWASQVGADVTGASAGDKSAKSWAIETGVTAPADGSSKEWATTTGSAVASSEFSAKEYAQGTTATGGSAKKWAQDTSSAVDTTFSAKEYAQGSQAGTGGSAKNWATQTGADVTGASSGDMSSKEWAVGTLGRGVANEGSAKDWATYTAGTVDNADYSAKYWALDAEQSKLAAKASASAVANVYDNFADTFLGSMADGATASSGTANGTWSASSSSITLASTSGTIEVGQEVTGTGIPADANVLSIDGSTIVISENMTNAGSSVALTFTGQGVYGAFNSSKDGPATDNDGNALVEGVLYFNTTDNEMRIYDGGNWLAATSAGSASILVYKYVATGGQTTFSGNDANGASLSYITNNIIVFLNGIKLDASDFTATSGNSVVLGSGATASDELVIVAFKSFTTADMVPASTGGTFSGNITIPTGTAPGHAVTKAQLDASGTSGISSSADATAISIDSSEVVTIENKIKVDDIEEKTSAHGVEIDGVLLKDGGLETSTTGKIKQKGAFMQSSTHQALTLGY